MYCFLDLANAFCLKKKQNFNFIDINTCQGHGKRSYTNMQLSVILYMYSQHMNNLQESNPSHLSTKH